MIIIEIDEETGKASVTDSDEIEEDEPSSQVDESDSIG